MKGKRRDGKRGGKVRIGKGKKGESGMGKEEIEGGGGKGEGCDVKLRGRDK